MPTLMNFPEPWSQFVMSFSSEDELTKTLETAVSSMSYCKFTGWTQEGNWGCIEDTEGKEKAYEEIRMIQTKTDFLLVIESVSSEGRLDTFFYPLAKRIADMLNGSQ